MMEKKDTAERFEKEIDEIDKGSDRKNPASKFERHGDFKKHKRHKKNRSNFHREKSSEFNSSRDEKDVDLDVNRSYQKFGDNDIKEIKDSENKPIKHVSGSLGAMSELARKKLSEALNKNAESVVSISKSEDGWSVVLEVIDEDYLPEIKMKSMNDIIGTYEIQLDDKGELISWNRKSSRKRGDIR
jgi:hypothetical protein